MNTLQQVTKTRLAEYDNDLYLGYLCWYHVPSDSSVSLSDWNAKVQASDLKGMRVNPPRIVDAFKRAAASVAESRRFRSVGQADLTYKFLVRDAGTKPDVVCRSLIVEALDADENRLAYGTAIRFTYDRGTERVLSPEFDVEFTETLPDVMQHLVYDKAQQVLDRFRAEADAISHTKVREAIRGVITGQMYGVAAHPTGSPYYVPRSAGTDTAIADNSDIIEQLANFVNGDDTNSGLEGCSFFYTPILDDGRHREMLRTAFIDGTTNAVAGYLSKVNEIMAGDTIHESAVNAMVANYNELKDRISAYREFLDEELQVADAELQVMFKKVGDLVAKAKG